MGGSAEGEKVDRQAYLIEIRIHEFRKRARGEQRGGM